MDIKIKNFSDYTYELLNEDVRFLKQSLYELKKSIITFEEINDDNEIYHRYCDVEDEVFSLLDNIIPKGVKN